MRIKVNDKVYSSRTLDEISLKDLIRFNTEAAELGIPERWADIEQMVGEIDQLTEAEAAKHPGKLLLIGVMLWVARRAAGEDVTFAEAVDVPLAQVDFLPDPEDRKPGKRTGAKRTATAPKSARGGSSAGTTPTT